MLQLKKPSAKRRVVIQSRASLAEHLDWALSVELSTIPPYLCALYSIKDNTSGAAQLIRSVVIEEMLHMMLVCNLRNAIGTDEVGLHPNVLGAAARYPTYVPHHAAGGPFVQLQAASVAQVRTVFMGIEQPAASGAPPQAHNYDTIGQFYEAIEAGFIYLDAQPEPLFVGDPALQQSASYFGGSGGRLFPVTNLQSARRAIQEIITQGEGASRGHPPRPGEEGFGLYDNYGLRDDGTIGPIVGARWELSHYSKFEAIANGNPAIGDVYPMIPNPNTNDLHGPLRKLSELFDDVYGILLRALQASVSEPAASKTFYSSVLPLMHVALPQLSVALMQTPLYPGADPSTGPNAGPCFWVGTATPEATLAACDALLADATDSSDSLQRTVWVPALQATRAVLTTLVPQRSA